MSRFARILIFVTTTLMLGACAHLSKGSKVAEAYPSKHECQQHKDSTGRSLFAIPVINEFPLPEPPPPADEPHMSGTVPILHSKPGATQSIYLDFDGYLFVGAWPWGANRVTPAYSRDSDPDFSASEIADITTIWKRVSEDFAPFNIDVTTEEPASFGSKVAQRVAIGGSYSDWYGSSAGGVAYLCTFTWSGDIPTYVFENNLGNGDPRYTAEAISHEVGHTLCLYHQSTYDANGNKTAEYDAGSGSGPTGWAPIMGVGYYQNLTTWRNGTSSNCSTCYQDDLSVITGPSVGVSYRADDVAGTFGGATALTVVGTSATGSGIIELTSDTDMFSFSTGAGTVTFQVDPSTVGPDLDIKIELYDSGQNLLASNDPAAALNASLSTSVAAGQYYLAVKSTGTYGRIGQYTIAGAVVSTGGSDVAAPVPSLSSPSVTTGGDTTYQLTVTYTDNVSVQAASIDSLDIVVTGPNSYSQAALLVTKDSNSDGPTRIATYRITPPGGSWSTGGNGTYTVALQANQIRDVAGNYTAASNIGTFTVSINDVTAPTATVSSAPSVTSMGGTTYSLALTYSDNSAINISTLGAGDVRVTGPNSFNALATFSSVNINANGTPRIATYTLTPPGGSWDAADAGTYTISVESNQVRDLAGNAVAAGSKGTFSVSASSYSLTGRVLTSGGAALAGVTIQGGSLGTQTSGTDGRFSYGSVAHGASYALTPSATGYDFSPTSAQGTLTANTDLNFTATLRQYNYTGLITFKGIALSGFSVSSTVGSAVSNASGYYQLAAISHGSALTVAAAESCYVTNESSYQVVAGLGATQLNFTVSGCASGCIERTVSGVPTCLLDSDGDGLTNAEESNLGTDPNASDSDGDGQADGYEYSHGSDPLDRGSYGQAEMDEAYVEWNNFLGGLGNIVEYTSLDDAASNVTASFRSIAGAETTSVGFGLPPRGKFDLLAHALNGFISNSYGLIHSRFTGKVDGGMLYYKRPLNWGGDPNDFAFVVMLEFTKGLAGIIDAPYNTFHPSYLKSGLLAANWAQITNVGAVTTGGYLKVYNLDGVEICSRRLVLNPAQRRDTSLHRRMLDDPPNTCDGLGPNQYGIARWFPDRNDVRFVFRVVRYLYNNDGSVNDFDSAFQLTSRIPSTEPLTTSLDTRAGSAIVEVTNGASTTNNISVAIRAASGALLRTIPLVLAPRQTRHVIVDNILVRSIGSATVTGSVPQGLLVVGMHYGRDAEQSVTWMYGINGSRAFDNEVGGAYNTYINMGCSTLLTSVSNVDETVTARIVRNDGSVVLENDEFTIPAHGTVEYNCQADLANNYGTTTFRSTQSSLVGSTIRLGQNESFRVPAALK